MYIEKYWLTTEELSSWPTYINTWFTNKYYNQICCFFKGFLVVNNILPSTYPSNVQIYLTTFLLFTMQFEQYL